MPRVAIVIPALNEEEVIARTVAAIPREVVCEVIVVDNGSTDRTAEEALRAGASVVSQPERGYGRAMRRGAESLSADCEIVVQMDADLSDDPGEIRMLLEPIIERDYDLGSKIASLMIRLIYGVRYTDMGPFRAIKRSALRSLEMSEETYGWSIEMQTKAASRGLRVTEIPVTWRNRAAGASKVAGTVSGSVRAGARIVWTILKVWRQERRTRPAPRSTD
jgi:glycosyltransferase involved in cell wall biosynthesis